MGIILPCYKNINDQNLDKKEGIIYINNQKLKEKNTIDLELINKINEDIKIEKIEKEEKKIEDLKIKDKKQPSAISTAMVSKKNSSKNIIKINEKPKEEKYIDNEIIMNNEELNVQVEKIQRAFREKIKRKMLESTEKIDSAQYLNLETSNNEITEKKFSETYIEENFMKTKSQMEKDIKLMNEYELLLPSYSHNNKFNKTIIRRQKNSQTISELTFHLINEISEISFLPKGNFITKKKKFKYFGQYNLKGKKQGFGIIKWEDGSILKANFEDSKINGYALFYDSITNSFFNGYYKDNCPKGFGIYKKDNVKIIGDSWFKNNIKKIGMEIYNDDNYYQGELDNSIKNGIGLYRWPDGTIYLGEWKNNKMDGIGLIKYSNDSIYIGEYKNGLMNGWGEFLWSDFKYYCGNYLNDFKDGFGIFVWNFNYSNLNAYIGFWENGKQNGIGIQLSNGKEKIGFFKDGRKNISLNGPWEIRDYLKVEQFKFQKFLEMDYKFLVKFVHNLKNNEILKENSVMFH